MANTKKVELTRKTRGHEPDAVVEVDSKRADELIRSGLAREPRKKAEKKAGS